VFQSGTFVFLFNSDIIRSNSTVIRSQIRYWKGR